VTPPGSPDYTWTDSAGAQSSPGPYPLISPIDLTFENLSVSQSSAERALIVGVLLGIGGGALIALLQVALGESTGRQRPPGT
jgi:hypothetical protein